MSDVWLEPHERALLVSKTRSGKSTVATTIASYFRCRGLFIDVKRRYRLPGAAVARGVDELRAALASGAQWIHFIPIAVNSPDNKTAEEREWHEVFAIVARQHDLVVLLDECVPKPASANKTPGSLEQVLGQKAVDRVGVIACTGRWRGTSTTLRAHTDHVLTWPGGMSRDELEDLAREMAISLDELRALLAEAEASGPYSFVWWDRNRSVFRIVPALPEHLRARAIAVEITP